MRGFKNFIESGFGDDYWSKRLGQFQAAASGEKGVITPEPNKSMRQYKSDPLIRRPIFANTPKTSRILTPKEIQSLGIHANHHLVWIGSTADAPKSYPYVYIRNTGKFLTNPHYSG